MTWDSRSRQAPRILSAVVLALAFLTVALPIHAADAPDLKAMMRKVADAWQTMDVAKVAPFYSKEADAVFFDATPLKYAGWSAYAAGWGEVIKDWTALSITLNDDAWIRRRGDVAVTAVTGRVEVTEKTGSKMALDVRWTAFWEKKGKDWIISHDHFSTPWVPPAGG